MIVNKRFNQKCPLHASSLIPTANGGKIHAKIANISLPQKESSPLLLLPDIVLLVSFLSFVRKMYVDFWTCQLVLGFVRCY